MSSAPIYNDRRLSALLIVLLFLFADLMMPQAFPATELQEESEVSYAQTSFGASADAMMDESNPTTGYGSQADADIGPGTFGETRLVISFPLTFNTSVTVSEAMMELTCGTSALGSTTTYFFWAELNGTFAENAVTWEKRNTNAAWSSGGADGEDDRSDWEPSSTHSMNGTFQLNVTSIVQSALLTNASSISLVVSAFGAQYTCHTREAINSINRPSLLVTYANQSASSAGTIVPDFVEDGFALMTGDFVLTADTDPTITWGGHSGQGVEFQLSYDSSFRAEADDYWHYTSMDNSTFTLNGASGTMTIPNEHGLSNGSTFYYRMRAMNNDQIGDWDEGFFHLPSHTVTDNGDGTATVSFLANSLGLDVESLADSYSDENVNSGNNNFGTETEVRVGMDSGGIDQYGYIRLNSQTWGMHSNASIQTAEIVFTRSSSSGSALVSAHDFSNTDWSQDGVTFNSADGVVAWTEGGREFAGNAIDSAWVNASDAEYRFDLTTSFQSWLDSQSTFAPSLFLTVRGESEGYTAGTNIEFYSTEHTTEGDQPYMDITYAWGTSPVPSQVPLIGPQPDAALWTLTDHNLSGNVTPELTWNTSAASGNNHDIILQMSDDSEFRNITLEIDTSTDSDFAADDGSFNLTSAHGLEAGAKYFWRMQHMTNADSHRGQWQDSDFFIPAVSSTYLGNGRYELRFKHQNSSSDAGLPYCKDTYIDSGSPSDNYDGESEMQVSYNTWPSETSILFGCDLSSHMLPSGYAVSQASLSLKLSTVSGNPGIGAWSNLQHNWTESGATWNTYDGSTQWGTAGAKGWERGSLLSATTISSSTSSGTGIEWNVTQGVQDAMRSDGQVDFILGVTGAGSGGNRDALLYSNDESMNSRPELVLVYVLGSDQVPTDPLPLSPANGTWSITPGIEPAPEPRPTLGWQYNGSVTIGGWAIEMDTVPTFDGIDLMIFASWNDNGFDMTNLTFDLQQDLSKGEIWYWRVRSVSTTNQLGNWSVSNHFLLPDITTWSIDNNTAAVELHHQEGLPSLNLPNFTDTWVSNTGSTINSTNANSGVIEVGVRSDGSRAVGLLRIPLNDLPTPQNAHVSQAILSLYPEWGSSASQHVSIHPALQAWNSNATGVTYDGVNNWTTAGALSSSSDHGEMVDVLPITHVVWTEFDVTELVQDALFMGQSYLSLVIIGDANGGLVSFTSTEGSANQPWMNLTWSTGNVSPVNTTGSPSSPSNGDILWDGTSHALLPAGTPSLTWTHTSPSSVDDWRVFIWENGSNEREGWSIADTRLSSSGFDIANLTWTPTVSQDSGRTYRWFVQPIIDDVLGPRSSTYLYHLPAEMSGEINSTDAWLNLVEGSMVSDINYPNVMTDSMIDSSTQPVNHGSSTSMTIGMSPTGQRKNVVIEYNLSVLPIPDPHEVVDATLQLYRESGNMVGIEVSICDLFTPFDESNVNWNNATSTTQWSSPGAYNPQDCSNPVDVVTVDASGWFEWDITQLAQASMVRGDEVVRVLLMSENASGSFHNFVTSESTNITQRPQLNVTLRSDNPWLPPAASGLSPPSGQTLWNMSAMIPTPVENVVGTWNSGPNNVTVYQLQGDDDPRFIKPELDAWSNDTNTWGNSSFDVANNTFTMRGSEIPVDTWIYWRVRSIQEHRISNWSVTNNYRMPSAHGSDDGTGNYSLSLTRASIFANTTVLPSVPDTTLDSGNPTTSYGSATTLSLGVSPSGTGTASIMIEFDLNEVPFPANMTPTSTLLQLYRNSISGGQSLTVAAYPCASFSESGATWNNAPTCSSTEITRTTLSVVPPSGWMTWDITSLAQSNIANGNRTLTVMLQVIGTPQATHQFASSEAGTSANRPILVLDYVDNSNGTIPPSQATLVYPADSEVLYDDTAWTLSPIQRPTFYWNPVANATDYILTIANVTGQTKYRSWVDSGFINASFTPSFDLAAGETYQWWVQAINGSIPGPSSSRWSFGIGNPVDNVYNNDNTYTYRMQNGEEVPELGHVAVIDSLINSQFPDEAFQDWSSNSVGTQSATEYRTFITLDASQLPLNPNANIHSASLGLYITDVGGTGGATNITLSIHPLLSSGYTSGGSTWNEESAGNQWSAPGLMLGFDYGAATDSVVLTNLQTGWIWLDLSHMGLDLTSAHTFILIGTPDQGAMRAQFYSSDHSNQTTKPVVLVNYTKVDNIVLTPSSGATTDADTPVQYQFAMYDYSSTIVAGTVEWSVENGTIDIAGQFSPIKTGTWNVKACFGLICETVSITVTPGAADTWQGAWNGGAGTTTATISADDSLHFDVVVFDQHMNIVTGEFISAISDNGTLTEVSPSAGYVNGWDWDAYATGNWTVVATWGSNTLTWYVNVEPGAPDSIVMGTCEDGDLNVPAGTSCVISWDLLDSHANDVNKSTIGLTTWTTTDGNVTNGTFTADKVGTWEVSLTSAIGMNASVTVTVLHGQMAYLELIASELSVTADDPVYLNATRVDVRGNRLNVTLPASNWTYSSGLLIPPTSGNMAVWHPFDVGAKTIEAAYENMTTSVIIGVAHGSIINMEIDVTTGLEITADELSTLKSFGVDNNTNRWQISVEWKVVQDPINANGWLSATTGATATFNPTDVGEFSIRAIYTEEGSSTYFMISTDYNISHGELTNIDFKTPADDDIHWDGDTYEMNADEIINFELNLTDINDNSISKDYLSWTVNGENVTAEMFSNNFVWNGTRAEGVYEIIAFNGSISEEITVNISHGRAISLTHYAIANTVEAGSLLNVEITGTDAANNSFLQDVTWDGGTLVKIGPGEYRYDASIKGAYNLAYSLGGATGGQWDITVYATYLDHFTMVLDKDTTEQLGTVKVTISAFDRFDNSIGMPSNVKVEASGRGEVSGSGNEYTVKTLDEGTHTVTVESVVNGNLVSAEEYYEVSGTFAGFFASGGPLYYFGGGLIVLVSIVLLGLIVILFRRSTDEYDDEDDYDDEDEEESGPTSGPSGPAPAHKVVPEVEETDYTSDEGYRVDEDGTEWWEDEHGTWWFRSPGDDDWQEWSE